MRRASVPRSRMPLGNFAGFMVQISQSTLGLAGANLQLANTSGFHYSKLNADFAKFRRCLSRLVH